MKNLRFSSSLHWCCLFVVVAFSMFLRLWHVADNPSWYTDEITHIEIAQNLMQGEIRYFAIQDSWLLFARLPLFEYLLAGLFQIFGVRIAVLRGFTGLLGVITGILLYVGVRQMTANKWLGLLCSAAYIFLPLAILYNRFGFSYNLLLPLIVLILWAYYNYRVTTNQRCLLLSAICIGLGCISDVIMWSFIPSLILAVWGIRWRDMIWAIAVALTPLMLYALIQLMTVPDAFLFDLGYTLARTSGTSIGEQMRLLSVNYMVLLHDGYLLIGIIGIVTLPDKQLRYVLFVMFVPMLLLGRTVPLYSLSAYYLLPFLPLIAIGIGAFLYNTGQYIGEHVRSMAGKLILLGLISLPILWNVYHSIGQVNSGFLTPIDAFLIDAEDAYAVAGYINSHADDDELVISSPPIGWLLNTQVADFQMAAIGDGRDAIHLPGNLPENRFAFPIQYQEARYIVIDDLWRNWGVVHIPQIVEMMADVQNWELIFEIGDIQVYER